MGIFRKCAAHIFVTLRKLEAILVTLTVRTHKKRWKRVAVAGRPSWDARNEKIASFIPAGSSVIDLGCGAQTLKRHLRSGVEYQPCDLVKNTPDVIVCDFNAGQFPPLDKRFTHVVCSGVLEYIRDHRQFLGKISSLGDNLILSYNICLADDSILQRMTNNWVNHFSRFELENIFREAGLSAECLDTTESGEFIYRLKSWRAGNPIRSGFSGKNDMRVSCGVLKTGPNEARLSATITCGDGQRESGYSLPKPPYIFGRGCSSETARGRNKMNISAPKVRKDGESVIVSAEFQTSELKDVLWFKLDAKYQDYVVTERGDAFLIGLLLYAMARGEDIHLDCPISEKLYYNLSNYLIPALLLANPKLRPVKVVPSKLEHTSLNTGGAVGAGFSGGVDSFFTFYDHFVNPQCPVNYRLTHLAFFNVGSHGDFGGEAARELFHKRLNDLKQFSIDAGLELIVVDSNISEILQISFPATHTFRNMAPVLLLQKLFRIYYYSSGYRMDDFRITNADSDSSAYDLLNMAMLSTESVDLYSSGCQHTRVEKTRIIADYEPTWRYLNVCASRDGNCSSCFKCMRTLLTLEILGKIRNYEGVFDLSKYRKQRSRYIAEILVSKRQYIYKDIYNEMRHKGIHVPMQSRLLACKHLCGSALRRMAKNVWRAAG